MLGYGCVGVFIVVSVVKRSLRVLWQQLFLAAVVCLAFEVVVLDYGCVFFYSFISCEALIESSMAATVV